MSLGDEIYEQFKKMLPIEMMVATVQEVDESNFTCTIAEDGEEDAPYYDVRLKPIIESGDNGVIPVPKIGSWVIAAKLGEDRRSIAVIVPGEIDKHIIKTDDVYVEVSDTVKLNGDSFGGVVKWPDAVQQLNILTARVDALYNALQNSSTAAQDGGATYKEAIVTILSAVTQKESFSNLENTKVKHG
ncbi:MAG: hypothetical protein CL843_16445 [Crocinitomicaceae bacterium]|nr:hypothetical protein [Crocinitomicaceae bacterium]|tara:strand:+ start:182 stop:742 length:561 start_codon:yes stop_codon:yes gene_type:complete